MRHLLLLLVMVFAIACGEKPAPQEGPPAAVPVAATPQVTMQPTATVTPLATAEPTTTTVTATPAVADIASSGALMVFAAASTTDAINELITAFSEDTGIVVKTNFGSSSMLAQQINAGAAADIFLSANEKWMDAVAKQTAPAARKDLLGNSLVAIVPADSALTLAGPAELNQPGITRLALGDPGAVPAGIYAKQALEKLGLWEPLKGRVVSANDVREALMFVERGEAEAGIVYATDAAITEKVKIAFEFDAGLNDPIVYPIARLSESEAAKALYDRLTSPQASEVFVKYGFVPLDASDATPATPAETPVPAVAH